MGNSTVGFDCCSEDACSTSPLHIFRDAGLRVVTREAGRENLPARALHLDGIALKLEEGASISSLEISATAGTTNSFNTAISGEGGLVAV